MNGNLAVGLVLLVVGLLLLYFGAQGTETITEQVHETFTGRYTDTTMWYLIGGAASAVAGLVVIVLNVLPKSA